MCEILNRTVILPRFIVNQEDELKILPFFLFDINVLESEIIIEKIYYFL